MRIAFCTPFKPLTHSRISGDVTIADNLATFFRTQGHDVWIVPQLTTQYLWKKPRKWGEAFTTIHHIKKKLQKNRRPDVWFTYHSYYKAPDILGSLAAKEGIPYTVFAPSYAAKRKKSWETKPGYYLNKRALQKATHLFTNKLRDIDGLKMIVPPSRITFIPPGIQTKKFKRDETKRAEYRAAWKATNSIVILTVAMLREGTKSKGVEHVITACHSLLEQGHDIKLVIAGKGVMRSHLEKKAQKLLPNKHQFLGLIPPENLPQIYSSCDIFAFPGINEGLGMVYLEAQSCGLPVVAWDHDGAPQVVHNGKTGIITPSYNDTAFAQAIGSLAASSRLRKKMGSAATSYVETHHNIEKNYRELDAQLRALVKT
ncbi:glycosyltransferase family 4 protein [Halodesulfovibrio marinisediminis]|uniref:Glycosyltransferase involved in cell wall bisynthesis n=1 Tax=Halodesulfovibrio marinisediminis DSM 17456 TaxID=1121457 RepID=A0A1N6HC55_9BACT|nr:glycosyltransferase family 4 protein [Halodesulfovibrio marinisediminis]SIO17346.1 Glycosyltransferase involved in cell wall bisynthesis [Halodesulfovibrio marinisediminis DSM 17456]